MNDKFNQLYNYLKSNGMTDLDAQSFYDTYRTDSSKLNKLYGYLKSNGMTDLDPNSFRNSYFGANQSKQNWRISKEKGAGSLDYRKSDFRTYDIVEETQKGMTKEERKKTGFDYTPEQIAAGKKAVAMEEAPVIEYSDLKLRRGKDGVFYKVEGNNWYEVAFPRDMSKNIINESIVSLEGSDLYKINDPKKVESLNIEFGEKVKLPNAGFDTDQKLIKTGIDTKIPSALNKQVKPEEELYDVFGGWDDNTRGLRFRKNDRTNTWEQYKPGVDSEWSVVTETMAKELNKRHGGNYGSVPKQAKNLTDQEILNKTYGQEGGSGVLKRELLPDGEVTFGLPKSVENASWFKTLYPQTMMGQAVNAEEARRRGVKSFEENVQRYVTTNNIANLEEEEAVKMLTNQFGRFGFEFIESGAGDEMIVRTKDGSREILINLDTKDPSQNLRLQDFLIVNQDPSSYEAGNQKYAELINRDRRLIYSNNGSNSPSLYKDLQELFNDEDYKIWSQNLPYGELEQEVNQRIGEYRSLMNKPGVNSSQVFKDMETFKKSPMYQQYQKQKKEAFELERMKMQSLYDEVKLDPGPNSRARQKVRMFLSDKYLDKTRTEYNAMLNDIKQSAKFLKTRYDEYNAELQKLNTSNLTPEQIRVKKEQLDKMALQLDIDRSNLVRRQKAVTTEAKQLEYLTGKYVVDVAKEGGFIGGLMNSFSDGISKMIKTGDVVGRLQAETKGSQIADNMTDEEKRYYKTKGYSLEEIKIAEANKAWKKSKEDFSNRMKSAIGDLATTKEYQKSEDRGIVSKALFGLAESLPAMATSVVNPYVSLGALSAQAYSSLEDEMLNDPDFETTPLTEMNLIALPYAIGMGALERYGLRTLMSNNPLAKSLIMKSIQGALKKTVGKGSAELLQNVLDKEIKSNMAKFGVRVLGGTLIEAETGATQSLVLDIGYKSLINEIKKDDRLASELTGGEFFDTPDSFMDGLKMVIEDGIAEGIGGMVMSGAGAISQKVINGNISLYDNEDVDFLRTVSTDNEIRKMIVIRLKSDMLSGKITRSEAQNQLNALDKVGAIFNAMPENLSVEDQVRSVNLMTERQRLEKEIDGKDQSLVAAQNERITEINNELQKISKDAFQKQTTGEVSVQPEARVSEEVEGRVPETRLEEVTEEGKKESINPSQINSSEISNRNKEAESRLRAEGVENLFIGANLPTGSLENAIPVIVDVINGITVATYANEKTGLIDTIISGFSEKNFVGYYRIYENGKPTNKWSSKFENQETGEKNIDIKKKDNFKTMIASVQERLPSDHKYTEKTSISTDGLRVWNNQIDRGTYELEYDNNGNLVTDRVSINGDALVNELGVPVNQGAFQSIRVKTEEEFNKVKKVLLPYLEKFGLNENNIYWRKPTGPAIAQGSIVQIDLPVLNPSKSKADTNNRSIEVMIEDVRSKLGHENNKKMFDEFINLLEESLNRTGFNGLTIEELEILLKGLNNNSVAIVGGVSSPTRNNVEREDLDTAWIESPSNLTPSEVYEYQKALVKLKEYLSSMSNRQQPQSTDKIEKDRFTVEGSEPIFIGDIVKNLVNNRYAELVALEGASQSEITIDKPIIASNTTAELDRVKSVDMATEDGATFNIDGTKYEGGGLVVPIVSENTTVEEITPEMISDFVEKHSSKIGDQNTVKVGIYKFPNSNKVSIDLNIVAPESSRQQAIEFAKAADQESLFDLSTFENVKTGGTGANPTQFTDDQFKEIAKALNEGRTPSFAAPTQQNLVTLENVEEVADKRTATATKLVLNALPDVKIYIHKTNEEYSAAIGEEYEAGDRGAYDTQEGAIHINLAAGGNAQTVFHEAIHHALLKKGMDSGAILDLANGLNRIITDKKLKKRLSDFISQYETSDQAEEYLSELGAIMAEAEIELTTTKFNQFKALIARIFQKLGLPKSMIPFLNAMNSENAVDFINSLTKSLRTGEEIIYESNTQEIKNPIDKIKKSKIIGSSKTKIEIVYVEQDRMQELIDKGLLEQVKDISVFNGKYVATTSPDDMLVGNIFINGDLKAQGNGGLFFVTKFGDVWASSNKIVADQIANRINKSLEINGGKGYLVLVKGTDAKLISSPQGASSSLKIVESLVSDGLISPSDFRKAVISALQNNKDTKAKINFSGKLSSSDMISAVDSLFDDVSKSSFDNRGTLLKSIIVELGKTESTKINSNKIIEFLGGDTSKNIGWSETSKNTKTSQSVIDLIAGISREELTKGLNGGDIYAIIEVNDEVKVSKDSHQSYPFHIKQKNGKAPKLILLENRQNGRDVMVSSSNENIDELGKSFDGKVLGRASNGYGDGYINTSKEKEGKQIKKQKVLTSDIGINRSDIPLDKSSENISIGKMTSSNGNILELSAKEINLSYPGKKKFVRRIEAVDNDGKKAIISFWRDKSDVLEKDNMIILHVEGVNGYGTDLINTLISESKEDGVKKIIADDVLSLNAAKYWEDKLGFSKDPDNKSIRFLDLDSSKKFKKHKGEKITAPVAGNKLFNEPLKDAENIARSYMQSIGMEYVPVEKITKLDEDLSKRISDAYDQMENNPNDPKVKAAYEAMAKETLDQYDAIVKEGYNVEINNNEPYSNSEAMIKDLKDNKRMKIFSTESGFGDEPITEEQRSENLLLKDSGRKDVNGETLLINDVFRFVHDFFGHAKLGNSFGPVGEENAWRVHSEMYSPEARKAMTSETRGQNSWVNFSGVNDAAFKKRDKARELRKEGKTEEADRLVGEVYEEMKFADQKVGILPDFAIEEGTRFKKQKPTSKQEAIQKAKDKYELSVEKRGNSHEQGVSAALGDLQKSDWFANADDTAREDAVREIKAFFGEKIKKAPSVAKILGKPKPETQTKTVDALRKEFFTAWNKASREAKADLNSKRKAIGAVIKSMVRSGKITTKQSAVITDRASSINLDNPVIVQRFLDYVAKVFADANYQEKLSNAFSARRAIRRLTNSNNQAEVIGMAKAFLNIDPSMVEDIDTYNEIADSIKNAMAPSVVRGEQVKFKQPANIADVNEYTMDEISRQEEIKKDQLLAEYDYLKDAGLISKDMTLNEIRKIIEDMKSTDTDINDDVKDFVERRLDMMLGIVESIIRTGINPITGESMEISDKNKDILKAIMKMDLKELDTRSLIYLSESVDNFLNNGITSGLEANVQSYVGAMKVKALVNAGVKSVGIKTKASKIASTEILSIPLLFEKLFRGTTIGTRIMSDMGLLDMVNGKNKAELIYNKILESYTKQDFYGKDFMTQQNIIERGMLAYLMRNVNGDNAQVKAELNRRIDAISESIEQLKEGNSDEQKLAEMYENAFSKLKVNSRDIDIIRANSSKSNREAVDWWVDQWKQHYTDLYDVSLSVYNTMLSSDINYTPDKMKLMSSKAQDDDITSSDSGFVSSLGYTDTKKAGVLMENVRKKPKNRYVDLNFDMNNANSLRNALVDINTAAAIRQVKGFIDSNNFDKLAGDESSLIKSRVNSYVKRMKGKRVIPRSNADDIMKYFNAIAKAGTIRALGGFGSAIKQFSPVINTLINAGRFTSLTPNSNAWIDRLGMPISNRGIKSEANIDTIDKRVNVLAESVPGKIYDGIGKIGDMWLKALIQSPDAYVARSSFITYYLKSLRDQGLSTKIDWNTHEVNKKAAEYAQMMVDRQQNVSDPLLTGELFATEDATKKMITKLFMPFTSFVWNQRARMINDMQILGSKVASKEDKIIAMRSLTSLTSEIIMFNVLGWAIRQLIDAVTNYFYGEDDDEEEVLFYLFGMKLTKDDIKELKTPFKNLFMDLLSPLPGLTDEFLVDRLNDLFAMYPLVGDDEIAELIKAENDIRIANGDKPMNEKEEAKFIKDEKEKRKFQLYDEMESTGWERYIPGAPGVALKTYSELKDAIDLAMTGKYEDEYQGRKSTKYISDEDREKVAYGLYFQIPQALGLLPREAGQIPNKGIRNIKKRSYTENQITKMEELEKLTNRPIGKIEKVLISKNSDPKKIAMEMKMIDKLGGFDEKQEAEYAKLRRSISKPSMKLAQMIKGGMTAEDIIRRIAENKGIVKGRTGTTRQGTVRKGTVREGKIREGQ